MQKLKQIEEKVETLQNSHKKELENLVRDHEQKLFQLEQEFSRLN